MSIAHLGEALGLESPAGRRAVRTERASVLRWRRLLRARLDLLVASYAPPEALDPLGLDGTVPPSAAELTAALDCTTDTDRVSAMHRLRELDRGLAGYAEALDQLIDASTEELVMRLVTDELARPDVR